MTDPEIFRRYVIERGDPVHDQLLDLLGGPRGHPAAVELEAMRAAGRCFYVELGFDAKRPPEVGGRSDSATGEAAPMIAPQPMEQILAGGPRRTPANKECDS